MNLYFFPTPPEGGGFNPYSQNYKDAIGEYFDIVDETGVPPTLNYPLLHFAFRADIFILNWVESAIFSKNGTLKFLIIMVSLMIIRLRKKRIVWMLHNLQPHEGENWTTKFVQNYLFKHASLIVAHSKQACGYAKQRARGLVVYLVHPVAPPVFEEKKVEAPSCDVLIWGTVLPYKGILEFVSKPIVQQSNLRIRIIGHCKDATLERNIQSNCNAKITFENRKIEFGELKSCIAQARFVLFPYVGNSVSSSGALIDTICLGGIPVGPAMGAFKDLAEDGVCLTYTNDETMMNILTSREYMITNDCRNNFIKTNSWKAFAKEVAAILNDKC